LRVGSIAVFVGHVLTFKSFFLARKKQRITIKATFLAKRQVSALTTNEPWTDFSAHILTHSTDQLKVTCPALLKTIQYCSRLSEAGVVVSS
jgi:uncharacterized protein YbcV (DUF1398 family)